MKNAFKSSFTAGYEKMVIIGTDCFELNESLIDNAFEGLNEKRYCNRPGKRRRLLFIGNENILSLHF